MADRCNEDDEEIPRSPHEQPNTSTSITQDIVMSFLVHVGVKFDGSADGYSGGRVGSMKFMEPGPVDWFAMQENLVHHGYKGRASLYYLKPGSIPPQGLVLMSYSEHLQQLMNDHAGLKECKLFIVKPPKMSRSGVTKHLNPDAYDSEKTSDSDDSYDNESYKYNPLEASDEREEMHDKDKGKDKKKDHTLGKSIEEVDDLYTWEGAEGDGDLYVAKTSKEVEEPPHKGQEHNTISSEISNASGYLPEETNDYCHSPLNSDDEAMYVHRSLGVDYVRFDESTMRHPIMNVGTVFTDVKQFREALKNLIICEGREVRRPKNDPVQVSAKCKTADCPWYIYAARLPDGRSFKIKKYVPEHTCGKSHTVMQMDAKWIAKEYEPFFRSDEDWRVKSLRDTVIRETQVGISLTKAYRSKRYAVQTIGGDYYEQYCRIQNYAHTLLHANPRSSIVLKCFMDPARPINPRFERMYVSFEAQIKGFLTGCRPFFGLDGTHVKLPSGGQILTAQGRDGNNNLFPIAFAVVEAENGNAWTWFLELLLQSIGHGEYYGGWTIISDRQKGLKDGVKIVFPEAEHRFCLRHLYANFSYAGFRGPLLKQLIDKAACSYKEYDFQQAMDEIKRVNGKAFKWLSDIDSKHWSRHRFSPNAKTDLVVNNISESYNACILEAREEPICTMVEHIRTKLMESISTKRSGAEKDKWHIAPNYKKKLELEKKNASYCKVVCAGHGIWQATCGDDQYVVDLNSRKCGCYKWDVTGVPCSHAIAAIHKFKHTPEDYMSTYFTREKYIASYEGMIMPVPDKKQWVKTDLPDVDPPLYHAQPGRSRKKRIRGQGESLVEARASKKTAIRCSNCKVYGHNVKGCGQPIRPDWEPRAGAKFTRASMGLPPISRSSQLDGSPRRGQQKDSLPEISSPQPAIFEGPILMNSNQGIGLYHDIEGGPRIRPPKLFPIRKRAS